MKRIKHIISVMLLGLMLLDCLDVCLYASGGSSKNPLPKYLITAISLHHHHHEELMSDCESKPIATLSINLKIRSGNTVMPAFACLSKVWQPPQRIQKSPLFASCKS